MKKKLQLSLLTVSIALFSTIKTNAQTVFLDFGSAASNVETGYTQITEASSYVASTTPGWIATAGLTSTDNAPTGTDLTSDFVSPNNSTNYRVFQHDLPAATYRVTMHFLDGASHGFGLNVKNNDVQSEQFTNYLVPADTYQTQVFEITMNGTDPALFGFFNRDAPRVGGGVTADTGWFVNGIDIEDTSTLNVEQEIEQGFKMYNNPQTKELKIALPSSGKGELTIFDITGKQVLSETLSADNAVNVSTLPVSVYIAKIVTDNGTISRKIALR